ncbi:MAG: hypothetical protein IKA02_01430, partial [Clostridia bacterium]|nr:hypothetical protein [Clostridia bacterium]
MDTYFETNNDNNVVETGLLVGKGYSNVENYAFLKFKTLPTIPSGAIVTNAKLKMFAYSVSENTNLSIGAYKITNSWTAATPHNTVLNYFDEDSPIDYTNVYTGGKTEWDITSLFKQWENGTSNYGIALNVLDIGETQGKFVIFASAENLSFEIPKLEVSYTTITGIENYYSYYQSSGDLAGEGYVNAFTGNLTFIHNIFTTSDEIMPFNLYTVYNSNTKKWTFNVYEKIEAVILSGIQYYKWTDGDGTEHWFAPYIKNGSNGYYTFHQYGENGEIFEVTTPTEFYDQSGLGLKLTVVDGKIYISDDKGNKKEFTNGILSKIEDTYGNVRTFVTMGTQTNIYLQPNGIETPILQLTMNEYDTDMIIENKQTGIRAYVISHNLINYIAYVLDDETSYIVDFSYSNGLLNEARNPKNNKGVRYNYTNNKVSNITEIANANSQTISTGNAMSISYSTMTSTSRTAGADNMLNNSDDIYSTYRFDNAGRVITAYSYDSDNNIYNSSSYQYNDMYKEDGVGPKLHNSIKTSFVNGSTTPNYLLNGAFENGMTGWTTGGVGTVSVYVNEDNDTFDAIDYGGMLKMRSQQLNTSTAEQSVYLTVGTYTLSASLFKYNMLDSSKFVIEVYNSANTKIASSREVKKEDCQHELFSDWEKESFSFDVSVAGNYTVIFKYSEDESSTLFNYMLIDEVMLERNEGNGTFSVYGNGGFETSLWSDSEKVNATKIALSDILQGNSALYLSSNLANQAYYKETYNVCGSYSTKDYFVISAWAKAEAIPSSNKSNSNATFGIELRTYYHNVGSIGVLF